MSFKWSVKKEIRMSKIKRMPELLSKAGLIFLGVLIALAVAEFAARLLGPPYGTGDEAHRSHQCDPQVGWRGVPNASMTISWNDYTHQVDLNSQGMHDREHPIKKADHVFRILMLGDSMVEALEVAQNETSSHVLEEVLNSKAGPGIEFEVINAGIFAWGPPQELMYFRTEGYLYTPDLVLAVWFPGNDLLDVLPDHIMTGGPEGGVHCFAPYFEICAGQFDPEPWWAAPGIPPTWQKCSLYRRWITNVLNGIYNHSRLYQRLTAATINVYDKDTFSTNLYAPWLDFSREDDVLNYAYQITKGTYSQLSNEADKIGAKTALIIAPVNQAVDVDVNPDHRAFMIAREPILRDADPNLPYRVFFELMGAEGVPVLDLHPSFVSHLKGGGEPLFWSDTAVHWNVLGNHLAGEKIAEWLIKQGLVPIEK